MQSTSTRAARTPPNCGHKICRSTSHQGALRRQKWVTGSASSPAALTETISYAAEGHQPIAQDQLIMQRAGVAAAGSSSRRQLMLSVSSVAVVAAAQAAQAAQTATDSCQLQDSALGLQWCDIAVGDGQLPIKGAFTKLNYTAKLASTGVVFDSTYQRRQPLIFKVGECEMVQAFDVAILGAEDIPPMHEGGKRLVVAPPGPMQRQGVKSLTWVTGLLDAIEEAGDPINPEGGFNSTLVFELELGKKRSR